MSPRNYKLLFADDELLTRPLMANIFRRRGFEVTIATTGSEAFELLRSEHKFDAVILDNMMAPGSGDWSDADTQGGLHTGLVVLKRLKDETDDTKRTWPPIWVLSALPDTRVEVEEREFKFVVDFVRKPYTLKELAETIRKHLELH